MICDSRLVLLALVLLFSHEVSSRARYATISSSNLQPSLKHQEAPRCAHQDKSKNNQQCTELSSRDTNPRRREQVVASSDSPRPSSLAPASSSSSEDTSWLSLALGPFSAPSSSLGTLVGSSLASFIGKVAKSVVYGGAQLARLNSRLLCALLTHESEPDNEDQPTLYVFNNPEAPDAAFRIYADDELTSEMLTEAKFDPDQATIFLVHGWLGGIHNEFWLSEAKNVALRHTGAFRPNVVVVDWSDLAMGSLYTATQNSRKVATRLARLYRQLAQVGQLKPQLMHCIGHSIGLHICGRAAREAFPQPASSVQSAKFGRISGVDPGGFCYELDIRAQESRFEGMRPSDALLTDAYYTNRSPFGNKFQVAQFNVRVNDAFFQRPCSVWRNPEVAREYFQATVRFLMGSTGHNDMLTCDHYFATRLAYQANYNNATPAEDADDTCSMLAYACSSHSDFARGRCGSCPRNSPADCYPMDFEYQRAQPSLEHAWRQLEKYSNFSRANENELEAIAGTVPYERRHVYYVINNGTRCARLFRLRVKLAPAQSGAVANLLPAGALFARLLDAGGQPVRVWDSWRNQETHSLRLHGPWSLWSGSSEAEAENQWRTGLFEVAREHKSLEAFLGQVSQVSLETWRNSTRPAQVTRVELDYLTSSSWRTRLKFSRSFDVSAQVLSSNSKEEK